MLTHVKCQFETRWNYYKLNYDLIKDNIEECSETTQSGFRSGASSKCFMIVFGKYWTLYQA
jgi:hypothetical protein